MRGTYWKTSDGGLWVIETIPRADNSWRWTNTDQERVFKIHNIRMILTTGALSTPTPQLSILPDGVTTAYSYLETPALAAATPYTWHFAPTFGSTGYRGATLWAAIPNLLISLNGYVDFVSTGGAGNDVITAVALCLEGFIQRTRIERD